MKNLVQDIYEDMKEVDTADAEPEGLVRLYWIASFPTMYKRGIPLPELICTGNRRASCSLIRLLVLHG